MSIFRNWKADYRDIFGRYQAAFTENLVLSFKVSKLQTAALLGDNLCHECAKKLEEKTP
jgi:hypothetical protein